MIFIALLSFLLLVNTNPSQGAEIIGGTEVKPHTLPFMALVQSDQTYCGGTLIHPKWVLTAAHCARSGPVKKVILGLHSLKNTEEDFKEERKVARQVIHPCFNTDLAINDLMLLELDQPVKKTKAVNWLILGEKGNYPKNGMSCLVAGWGQTRYFNGAGSDVLLSAPVTVIDRTLCKQYGEWPFITKGMICAGFVGKNQGGVWKGDSGGPLLCNKALVGVTSFGKPLRPGVFAYLSGERLAWIKETIENTK
ncbi:granzyme A-like [Synchiropus splendidus]|uniref:granzyme A-like n=1 Tax=Synchiropus splendidus TaxID=270530 RepID=UPI00237D5D3F|nr:granzyme A-like [Synchiropus splendidus]